MKHKNTNQKKFRSFQRKLTAGIIVKFIVSLTVYMILLLLALLIGYLICSSFTWYGDELIYRLLQPIRNNIELFVLFMFLRDLSCSLSIIGIKRSAICSL